MPPPILVDLPVRHLLITMNHQGMIVPLVNGDINPALLTGIWLPTYGGIDMGIIFPSKALASP